MIIYSKAAEELSSILTLVWALGYHIFRNIEHNLGYRNNIQCHIRIRSLMIDQSRGFRLGLNVLFQFESL